MIYPECVPVLEAWIAAISRMEGSTCSPNGSRWLAGLLEGWYCTGGLRVVFVADLLDSSSSSQIIESSSQNWHPSTSLNKSLIAVWYMLLPKPQEAYQCSFLVAVGIMYSIMYFTLNGISWQTTESLNFINGGGRPLSFCNIYLLDIQSSCHFMVTRSN